MNIDRHELEGWALEPLDFDHFPSDAGYIFRNAGAWYVCYPQCGVPVDRYAFSRIVDLLRRVRPDALPMTERAADRDGIGVRGRSDEPAREARPG